MKDEIGRMKKGRKVDMSDKVTEAIGWLQDEMRNLVAAIQQPQYSSPLIGRRARVFANRISQWHTGRVDPRHTKDEPLWEGTIVAVATGGEDICVLIEPDATPNNWRPVTLVDTSNIEVQ